MQSSECVPGIGKLPRKHLHILKRLADVIRIEIRSFALGWREVNWLCVEMVVYSFYIFDRHGEYIAASNDLDVDAVQRTVSTSEDGSLLLHL